MKENEIEEYIFNLKNSDNGYVELNLQDFKQLYLTILDKKVLSRHTAIIIFIEENVDLMFIERPCFRFNIKNNNEYLTSKNFDFVIDFIPYGSYEGKYTFNNFIKDEINLNGTKLIVTFFLFASLTLLALDYTAIRTINELVLTSITIFLSIFLLFIVSQKNITNNIGLFKTGYIFDLIQTDKYILNIAVVVLLLSISNTGLTLINCNNLFQMMDALYIVNSKHLLLLFLEENSNLILLVKKTLTALLTALNVTLITECYISIFQYYFEREKVVNLTKVSNQLFEKESKKYSIELNHEK